MQMTISFDPTQDTANTAAELRVIAARLESEVKGNVAELKAKTLSQSEMNARITSLKEDDEAPAAKRGRPPKSAKAKVEDEDFSLPDDEDESEDETEDKEDEDDEEENDEEDESEEDDEDEKSTSLADVITAFKKYSDKFGRDKAIQVLNSFGAKQVKEIKPAQFEKVLKKLSK